MEANAPGTLRLALAGWNPRLCNVLSGRLARYGAEFLQDGCPGQGVGVFGAFDQGPDMIACPQSH